MKLVVAIDGKQSADTALAHILKSNYGADTQVYLLHAVVPGFADMSVQGIPDPAAEEKTEEETVLAELAKSLSEKIGAKVKTAVLSGEVTEIVAHACKEFNADEAIVPSHARHGLSRLWYGSLAEEILEATHCTVVVPKIPQSKK